MSKDNLRRRIQERMDAIYAGYEKGNVERTDMLDSLTRAELIKAIRNLDRNNHGPLKFGEYWTHEALANDLLMNAEKPDKTAAAVSQEKPPFPANTLTVAELDRALQDLKISIGSNPAARIYKQVVANRENFGMGDIVKSGDNNVYERVYGGWKTLSARRNERANVEYSTPVRPLTKIGRAL